MLHSASNSVLISEVSGQGKRKVNLIDLRRYFLPPEAPDGTGQVGRGKVLLKELESLVSQKGGSVSLGSLLQALYKKAPEWKSFLSDRGGAGAWLKSVASHTHLRIETGVLGGASRVVGGLAVAQVCGNGMDRPPWVPP